MCTDSVQTHDPHYAHVYTRVCTAYTHVCTHVLTHVCTHIYTPIFTQAEAMKAYIVPKGCIECGKDISGSFYSMPGPS